MVLALGMRCASRAFQEALGFPKTIAFSVSIGISNIWEIEWLLLRKCSETAVCWINHRRG